MFNDESIPVSSYSKVTRWKSGGGQNTAENRVFDLIDQNATKEQGQRETLVSVSARDLRYRRNIKQNLGYFTEVKQSKNLTFVIKYEDCYGIWNNFSINYKGKIYPYDTYRVMNDGLYVFNSSDDLIQQRWRNVTVQHKHRILYKHCSVSVGSFYHENYTLFKDFKVFFKPTSQYFTREDYGVISGYFSICSAQLSLSCNDYLLKVKYREQYKIFNDFSLIYNNRKYDYREYRVNNNMIEMCASNHSTVLHIWRTRNSLEKSGLLRSLRCNKRIILNNTYYTVNKQFTIYYSPSRQYFTRHDYNVREGRPAVCKEIVRPNSYQYSKEDLLMCNDSIINIKYKDEYKILNNFSILHKNKMYSYTEYRALNDNIKICNSTDKFTKNIWKLRNYWFMYMYTSHSKNCAFVYWTKESPDYTVSKLFTVYYSGSSQYFTRLDYNVKDGTPGICLEKLRNHSYQYTKEDLLMCNDSIINIKYDDEYKVWNNFSILYKNKMYSYTEYRALNDGIKICNSTDDFVKNIWKLRNNWVMATRHSQSCKTISTFYKHYYIINKDFTVYVSGTSQYFSRHDYDVRDGEPIVCSEIVRPNSYHYTRQDLLMCSDSIINIKYDDKYKVWNNFSMLYKNKMYNYTEYRALNDSIKICNSTDNFVKNIWTLRNFVVMWLRVFKTCIKPVVFFPLYKGEYHVRKNFTVFIRETKLLIAKDHYGLFLNVLFLCVNKCVNSTSTINYEDEYRVWNNFSIMYKGQMYHYFEYRVTDKGVQICNSSDRLIKETWQNLTALEKRKMAYSICNVHVAGFYHENYSVCKNFSIFFKPTNQSFSRQDYGVISGYFVICSSKLNLSCNESLVEVKYGEQYEVFKNFSMFYKNTVYDYRQYRFSLNGVKICISNDARVQAIWKTQNKWRKSLGAPCGRSYKLNAREYTVTKAFAIHSTDDGQIFNRYEYAVIDAFPYVCKHNAGPNYTITHVNIIIAPLCALALSFICLVILLMTYSLLPELRTLPGLNLMSLCFAFLLWQIYLVVFLSSYSHLGKLSAIPCERLFIITKFITYSILMNGAVNIYHLRKTFCGNSLVKSEDVKKWRNFLKYSVFSWGVPVSVAIVYIVLVKTQALNFNQHVTSVTGNVQPKLTFNQRIELDDEDKKENIFKFDSYKTSEREELVPYFRPRQELWNKEHNISINKENPPSIRFFKRVVLWNEYNNERIYHYITGDCINGRITPSWSAAVDVYGIQGGIMLYIVVTFSLTAYQIRQKLKAGQSIAQNSNVVRHRKFILLLKLSTTTALSYWFPLFLSEMIDFNFDIKIALYTVTLLTGAYVGIAFAFTRRNYQLLKKKYFPAKDKQVYNRVAANEFELKKY